MRLPERIRFAITGTAGTGALFTIIAVFAGGLRAASSVALGAALATGNLYILARLVRRGGLVRVGQNTGGLVRVRQNNAAPNRGLGFFVFLKMAALLFAAFLVLNFGLADPLPFVVGCAALPVGLVLGTLASDHLLPPEE